MSLFALAAALLLIGVVAALLWPLLGARAEEALPTRAAFDRAVYRDQLVEIDRDLERGLFTAEEADAARLEVERRLLAAAAAEGETRAPLSIPRGFVLAAVGLGVPAAAVALYLNLGAVGAPDLPLAGRQGEIAERGDMGQLVGELRARLERNPDSVDGWLLYARSSLALGRTGDAADAFARVAQLTNRAPDILAAWGETLAMINANQVSPAARKLFEEALAGDPTESRARFYLGLAKSQGGDLKGALEDWTLLVRSSPPEAPWLPALKEQISRAASELGVAPPSLAPAPSAGPSPAPGPSHADVEALAQMSPEERQAMVRSMVERLAQRLSENPDDRDGWLRLGRSYEVLGETAKAEEAFARARALEGAAAKP